MCTSWPLSPISLTPTSTLATTNLLCFHELRSLVGWLKIPPVSDNIWYLSFSVWLISINIIPSRSTHVVVNYKFLFFYFWMRSIPLCMCIYICVCVYVCVCVCVCIFLNKCFHFLWIYTQKWNYWSDDSSIFHFWGNPMLFSTVATPIYIPTNSVQFSSVAQSCLTLWDPMDCRMRGLPVHHQLPELLKLMSIELVMPSNHLILCHPLLLLPSIFTSIRIFPNESVLHIRWPKYWSFSICPSNEYSGLISFRMNWLDLLAVQGTLKSLLQHHSLKASILWCSSFFIVQLSHPHMTTWKTIALTRWTLVSKVMSLLFNMLSRQCTRDPIYPHPCQCFYFVVFFLIAILTDVK